MNKRLYLLWIFILVFLFAGCGSSNKEEKSVFDESAVLTYPGKMTVRYGTQTEVLYPETVSWAYAINEEEWCSVISDAPHPIDQDYSETFSFQESDTPVVISFPETVQPSAVGFLHKYDLKLWAPNENNEELKLKDALERELDYNDFEDCGYEVSNVNGYVIKINSDGLNGYVYEIQIAWDMSNYRGIAVYSFVIGD